VPALAALALVSSVCSLVVAYEALRYRRAAFGYATPWAERNLFPQGKQNKTTLEHVRPRCDLGAVRRPETSGAQVTKALQTSHFSSLALTPPYLQFSTDNKKSRLAGLLEPSDLGEPSSATPRNSKKCQPSG
jgi:hypothetical protein